MKWLSPKTLSTRSRIILVILSLASLFVIDPLPFVDEVAAIAYLASEAMQTLRR